MSNKTAIIEALYRFINQRPGLEPRNYISDWRDTEGRRAYHAEARQITKDLHQARDLLAAVAWRDSITGDHLVAACQGSRLDIQVLNDGAVRVDYCTGQYWPTEYRRAVCRVLSSVLWTYWRECGHDGPKIRQAARQNLSRAIAQRFFN